jgi:hypothetical protein
MTQLSAQRDVILAALATVPGLSPAAVPSVVVPGTAWPAWRDTTWITQCRQEIAWYVFVALPPGSQETAVAAGDDLMEAVSNVLWPLGTLATVEPYQWMAEPGGQAIPVLRFLLEV